MKIKLKFFIALNAHIAVDWKYGRNMSQGLNFVIQTGIMNEINWFRAFILSTIQWILRK